MEPIQTLGKLLKGGEQRDAIHIAILPVVSDSDYLSAGQRLKFVYGTTDRVQRMIRYEEDGAVGVVDPFLAEPIHKGQRFWMFMLPNTITGLRHEWTHPAVDNEPTNKSESEVWLRRFADSWGFDYNEMIGVASNPSDGEWNDYIIANGRDLHSADELGGDLFLFWDHMEAITGRRFESEHRAKVGWSCSC